MSLCDSCKAPTLDQRFCPTCGTIQKHAKVEGVAAATVVARSPAGQGTAGPTPPGPGAAMKKGAKGPKGAKKGPPGPGAVPPPSARTLPPAEVKIKFEEAIAQCVDEQAMVFLRAFCTEFQGSFEQVLQLGESFKSVGEKKVQQTLTALDQFEAHRFLESQHETRTAADLRATLQFLDLKSQGSLSFLEYLLVRYSKQPWMLFEESDASPELLRKLEEAVARYRRVFAEKREREEKMDDLRARAAAGDVKAKSELRRMEMEDPAKEAKDEASALHAKLAAKRALANPDDEKKRVLEEEQRRLAEAKRQQEADEKRKKAESKARLAQKASLWK